jgi:hypothetical protein
MIEPRNLTPRLASRLLAYAAVAGVGLAACHSTAEAEVVYTPAHNYINGDFYLDLNHDGILDFHIHSYYIFGDGDLEVIPMIPINRIAAVRQPCFIGSHGAAAPLPKGAAIGPAMRFGAQATCMERLESSNALYGPWLGQQDRYLGLAFYVKGQLHYGWARMSVASTFYYGVARILGYAYETIPNKSIVAGDEGNATEVSTAPASLGVLALGAPGLDTRRKQENWIP